MPVVNNNKIDAWLQLLEESGNATAEWIERVRELAREANTQWKRKALVQRMVESVRHDRRRAVPIEEIFDVYGVHFTTETMQILEDGIQQSLRNFSRMLMAVLSTWDDDFVHRHDRVVLERRLALAVSHAPSCLWGSIDCTDLCQSTVHARLLRAVEGLWNTHAKPAIETEHHHLAEGIQRLRVLTHVCDEYLRPGTGGKAVPSKFTGLYARMHQRAIAALAWLSGNECFWSGGSRSVDVGIVGKMLNAYKAGEIEARASMDEYALRVRDMLMDTVQVLERMYSHDVEWEGWHGVLVWGSDDAPPAGATSSLVVQPPSYSASYWTTSRVYCSVAPFAEGGLRQPVRSQPVVRFCAMLRLLVHRHYLRLDLVGVDYLGLLAHADHARYHRNVNKIVEDELMPVGHLCGHAFDAAWFLETRAPVVYNSSGDDGVSSVAVSDTGLTDDCERALAVAPVNKTPPPPLSGIPEGVVLDHCLMSVVALLARSCVEGDHMGPYCNTFHVGAADVEPLVRNALGANASSMTAKCLSQRLAGIFKMFGAALLASGMQASFGADKSHPRTKKLKVSWSMCEQHRAKNLARLAQLADAIASHLHHGSALPEGVEWNIPDRSRRRRQARDEKCASGVLTRCLSKSPN